MNFTQLEYNTLEEISKDSKNLLQDYDIFLVGSDQVWNHEIPLEMLKVYLLTFIEAPKKISYASSISSIIPDELVEFYKEHLKKFRFLSVREKLSAKEVEKVLGYMPQINVDPTLLLRKEDWENIAVQPKEFPKKPYIFVYDLYRSEDIVPVIEKIAQKKNLEYINFDPVLYLRERKKFENLILNFYKDGPSEFLWLIKESDFVVTSSFHGVVFSILFNKPFYAILWDKKEKQGQNDRIISLLSELGLEDRCTENPKDLPVKTFDNNIDWNSVSEKLNQLRHKSAKWLLEALEKIQIEE